MVKRKRGGKRKKILKKVSTFLDRYTYITEMENLPASPEFTEDYKKAVVEHLRHRDIGKVHEIPEDLFVSVILHTSNIHTDPKAMAEFLLLLNKLQREGWNTDKISPYSCMRWTR